MPVYDERLATRLRSLGDQVRDGRKKLGISQEELADLSGLHRTYIGAVERGERNLTVGSLYTLADALGVHASDLIQP